MRLNDRIGDCTCAAAANLIESWSANASSEVSPTDAQVLAAYSAVSGYDPATGANDNGADLLTVCEYWSATGIAGNKVLAYAEIRTGDLETLKQAVHLFGGAYIGLNLPASAERQFAANQPWDVTLELWPNVGGHCVPVLAYDAQWLYVPTWGRLQKMSYRFFERYCDESYALVNPLWFRPALIGWAASIYRFLAGEMPEGPSPSGFRLAELMGDLQLVRAS